MVGLRAEQGAKQVALDGHGERVVAPMAFFWFSGWKESFLSDLHGQGLDAVEFLTQKKVVIERWPKERKRKF